jgi:hypothetical protein
MELFNGLMSGNKVVGGVDLSNVINNLQTSISTKINNGEIDPAVLRSNIMEVLPDNIKENLNVD